MPTYDYRCGECGHELELFQSFSESPKRKCPQCGRLKLKRVIGTGAAIIFKGSGFYETDYRSESYKKGAEAEKKAGETPKPEDAKDKKKDKKAAGDSKDQPAT
jgi:putative FmdB family regulatory protein